MTYPVIGAQYTGPALNRPCLRQMPRGWSLELEPGDHSERRRLQRLQLLFFCLFLVGEVAGWLWWLALP